MKLAGSIVFWAWGNARLAQMKARELELSEEEWFQMQFLESQQAGIPMNPIASQFMDFLDTLNEKKAAWERRKQAKQEAINDAPSS